MSTHQLSFATTYYCLTKQIKQKLYNSILTSCRLQSSLQHMTRPSADSVKLLCDCLKQIMRKWEKYAGIKVYQWKKYASIKV